MDGDRTPRYVVLYILDRTVWNLAGGVVYTALADARVARAQARERREGTGIAAYTGRYEVFRLVPAEGDVPEVEPVTCAAPFGELALHLHPCGKTHWWMSDPERCPTCGGSYGWEPLYRKARPPERPGSTMPRLTLTPTPPAQDPA
jgi:hypothetical protein